MRKLKTFTSEVLNNQIFDFYRTQIDKIIRKSKKLESTDDQTIALAIYKDTIETFNETFNWKIYEGKDL